MRVRDLQEFLSKFTENKKDGSSQGKVQTLGPWSPNTYYMYRGSRIRELVTQGLKLDACYLGLEACRLALAELGA
jgi:hypothetical protein